MKNILIICSDYMSESDANGICIRNITNELIRHDCSVYIISESEKSQKIYQKNNVYLYGCRKTWFMRFCSRYENSRGGKRILFSIVRLVRGIFASLLFPNVSRGRTKEVYKMADRIISDENIDMVIGAYRPYESIAAARMLKEKYGANLIVCTYHLDLLLSPNSSSLLIQKYKEFRGKKALDQELKNVDHMLIPESARGIYPTNRKIDFIDFPLFLEDCTNVSNGFEFDKNAKNIAYIGTIDGKNREINTIINALKIINECGYNVQLHIWGIIRDSRIIDDINKHNFVYYYGEIENKYAYYLLSEADYCLNLSNKITYNMVPSKIFQLFSVKKPIINIVEDTRDKSLEYFRRNNYTLNLFSGDSDMINSEKLLEWISVGKYVGTDNVGVLYEKSKPWYTVRSILTYLQENVDEKFDDTY